MLQCLNSITTCPFFFKNSKLADDMMKKLKNEKKKFKKKNFLDYFVRLLQFCVVLVIYFVLSLRYDGNDADLSTTITVLFSVLTEHAA